MDHCAPRSVFPPLCSLWWLPPLCYLHCFPHCDSPWSAPHTVFLLCSLSVLPSSCSLPLCSSQYVGCPDAAPGPLLQLQELKSYPPLCVVFRGSAPAPPQPLPCPGSGVSLILPCLFPRLSPSRPSPSVLVLCQVCPPLSVSQGSAPALSSHPFWIWCQVYPPLFPGVQLQPPIPICPGSGIRYVLPCLFPRVQPQPLSPSRPSWVWCQVCPPLSVSRGSALAPPVPPPSLSVLDLVSGVSSPVCFPGSSLSPPPSRPSWVWCQVCLFSCIESIFR